MRKHLFEIIDFGKEGIASKVYDWFMMAVIVISILPMMMKHSLPIAGILDMVTVAIFVVDYVLRLITADLKLGKGKISFIRYPFTFLALIDLVSILPSFIVINKAFRLLKVVRLLRTFRVFRVFKALRYSRNIRVLKNVVVKSKNSLIAVGVLAGGYILIIALIMFNFEPETFNDFFEAFYWATVSLTTVGYGDIYAVSTIGRAITMVGSVIGIAIVALPAGIITAGYMDEIQKEKGEVQETIAEPSSAEEKADRLIRLYEMRENGALTTAEWEKMKQELMRENA